MGTSDINNTGTHPHFTIGIAGHIDHGKTTLTKALTGQDTDRLKEEKERNISIELGFASFTLSNGHTVSVVDVPGHERFIRQMVAGVAGIDMVLLVVAADEGVMPQTKEHLDILNLLNVNRGLIVITKADKVDEEFIELVTEQIKEETAHTFLSNSPIVEVDSLSGRGIDRLKQEIENLLANLPSRPTSGIARLPIDRVFSKKGFGTIVTGTLYQGKISVGDEMEILPQGLRVKVRQLQVHGSDQEQAYAGQRVAVNLSGVDKEELSRGDVLVTPGSLESTQRIDVEVTLLDHLDFTIKQRSDIRLHLATSDILGRIIFFDRNECQPGETCFAQLELKEPVTTLFEDRFVLRRPTPMTTIGGGMVIDPYATKHRFGPETIKLIAAKKDKDVSARAKHILGEAGMLTLDELTRQLGISPVDWQREIDHPAHQGLKQIESQTSPLTLVTTMDWWEATWNQLQDDMKNYHQRYPLREGLDRKQVQNKYFPQLNTAQWNLVLQQAEVEGRVQVRNEALAMPGFEPMLRPKDKEIWQKVNSIMLEKQLEVPPWEELLPTQMPQDVHLDLQQWLVRYEYMVPLDEGRFLSREAFDKAVQRLKSNTGKSFTIQEAKDIFNTTRKYLIPFLETLDKLGYTTRKENKRYWKQRNS
ncbi:selenocysteine-specific translation elongation factor [Caldalkalibacillus thermarum]|uniref:selenocysteine-specific translation elongation factor n=1 Tax=Caldalkalibacillus thermarum TaxID=296745 RepID=UPI00166DD3D8|nr:selenocysteine-specific translation elongation factor [Caldalkalibacillus thermarum]GGK20145.1 selenocysteine-specific translation elongation factor [Caldalkalibacillus thermarum]